MVIFSGPPLTTGILTLSNFQVVSTRLFRVPLGKLGPMSTVWSYKFSVVEKAEISLQMFMFGLDSFTAKHLIVLGSKEAKPDNGRLAGVAKAYGSVRKWSNMTLHPASGSGLLFLFFLAISQLTKEYSESGECHALNHSGAHTRLHGIWLCIIK